MKHLRSSTKRPAPAITYPCGPELLYALINEFLARFGKGPIDPFIMC